MIYNGVKLPDFPESDREKDNRMFTMIMPDGRIEFFRYNDAVIPPLPQTMEGSK